MMTSEELEKKISDFLDGPYTEPQWHAFWVEQMERFSSETIFRKSGKPLIFGGPGWRRFSKQDQGEIKHATAKMKDGGTFCIGYFLSRCASCRKLASTFVKGEAYCRRHGHLEMWGKEPLPDPSPKERKVLRANFRATELLSAYDIGRVDTGNDNFIVVRMDKNYLHKMVELTEFFLKHPRSKPPLEMIAGAREN